MTISSDQLIFFIVAVAGSPAIVTVISEVLRGRRERRRDAEVAKVRKEAAAAQAQAAIDGARAQEAAATAQGQAADAIRQAVEASKATGQNLEHIRETTDITHRIVNSEHTAILRLVADLRGQIARADPNDAAARNAADAANAAAEAAEKI